MKPAMLLVHVGNNQVEHAHDADFVLCVLEASSRFLDVGVNAYTED